MKEVDHVRVSVTVQDLEHIGIRYDTAERLRAAPYVIIVSIDLKDDSVFISELERSQPWREFDYVIESGMLRPLREKPAHRWGAC